MKKIHCFLFLLLVSAGMMAQKKVITGRVVSQADSTPIAGVSIVADKQKGGAVSGKDGVFSITIQNIAASKLLIFSSVGYAAESVVIDEKTPAIEVAMKTTTVVNDDAIVIGYGTQKKSSVTGAVSKFQNDRLEETPNSRLDQALQGKIAGVQVQNVSSEAGADPKVRVRGLSSINAGASPLVVVDGHPVPDGLAFVNMADVQSVEVLKDAASAAIYGSRGASGVIMITTKSGKVNKTKYSLKMSTGVKEAYKLYPMMSTTEYTNLLFYEASLKAKDGSIPAPTGSAIATDAERSAYVIEQQIRNGRGTDWQEQAIRGAATKNVQLAVSGGNNTVKYYLSGGYQNDQGMMYHSEYERFTIKSKIEAELSKKMKLSFNFNPSYIKRERPSVNYIDFVRFQSYLPVYLDEGTAAFVRQQAAFADVKAGDWAQARFFNNRSYSGVMPDGSTWTSAGAATPFNTANNTPKSVMETRTINSNDYRSLVSADLTYRILPGLDFKTLASVYVSYTSAIDFAKRNSNRAGDVNTGTYNKRLVVDLLSENTFTYTKRFKNHSLNVLAGFTAQKTKTNDDQAVGIDYPSDNVSSLNTALQVVPASIDANGNLQGTFNVQNQTGLLSYLGRINYAYDDKYLLSASFRTDGSSYFAPGNKWGSFPSVSAGWVASKEKFLNKATWLSNLKLRGSYGVTGNNRIVDFAFVDLLYAANYPFGTSSNGTVTPGQVPSRTILSNPDITWERTFQFNGGIDVALLRNAVTFSIDAYQSKTDQLLLRQAALAFTGVPQTWNNIGKLKTTGVDFEITANAIRKRNFTWSITGNLAHNRNRVLQLGAEAFILNQGERTELYRNKVGEPLIQYFGYKTDGVWLSQAQIDAARAGGLSSNLSNVFVPGGLKLVDINGDNVIDVNDRTVIGNPYPDFTWGLTNNFRVKNFDVMFLLQGVQGGSLVNGDANYNETKRYNSNYNKNRWLSPAFPGDGKTPYSTIGFNWMLTDYVVEDASYYALREVLVGYTLPEKFARRIKFTSLRLYFSGQNLFFHSASGYRGINPEARFSTGPYNTPLVDGYQRGGFPLAKTFLFGIDINF
jgi:TonB-dependent starch-binding outer membrane protein SusC